jgi:hypothetical protein
LIIIIIIIIIPLVCSQGQTDFIYFYFSNAFDSLPHALLLRKLNNYGLSSGYLNWFLSCLTNTQSCLRFSSIRLSPFVALSGVPQGSALGPLYLNIFINDLCDVITHSNCFIFADDHKVYLAINSRSDC